MEQSVWQEIEQLYQKFQKLGINETVDYDKYYLYSLITHSTVHIPEHTRSLSGSL
mgnify:CR=1 FL=1